jgi:hypothetical protein
MRQEFLTSECRDFPPFVCQTLDLQQPPTFCPSVGRYFRIILQTLKLVSFHCVQASVTTRHKAKETSSATAESSPEVAKTDMRGSDGRMQFPYSSVSKVYCKENISAKDETGNQPFTYPVTVTVGVRDDSDRCAPTNKLANHVKLRL